MRRYIRKKRIKLHECSECRLPFDIDELKILWKEYRLVCGACMDSIRDSVTHPTQPEVPKSA